MSSTGGGIRFDASALTPAIVWLRGLPDEALTVFGRVVERTAQETARQIRRTLVINDSMAFSTLANSVNATPLGPLEWRAGPNVAYARFVEDGRRAGATPPPIQPIRDWMAVRGIDGSPFAIARSIGRQGIPGKPFVRPVVPWAQARLGQLMQAASQQLLEGAG